MNHQICLICHQKNNTSMLHQLKRIQNKVAHYLDDTTYRNTLADKFIQSTHLRCTYSISCDKLRAITNESNHIAIQIAPKIVTYIKQAEKYQTHELLQLTRGYFPSAYKAIEHLWYETHKTN